MPKCRIIKLERFDEDVYYVQIRKRLLWFKWWSDDVIQVSESLFLNTYSDLSAAKIRKEELEFEESITIIE